MAQTKESETASPVKASSLRLLVLTPSTDDKKSPPLFPAFLERLTGTAPSIDTVDFAGYTSHPALHLKTRYYDTNIGIWCDEFPAEDNVATSNSESTSKTSSRLEEWEKQMLSAEAREVRDAIGGIILLFPLLTGPSHSISSSQLQSNITTWISYVDAVSGLRDAIEADSGRDVAGAVVLQAVSSNSLVSTDLAAKKDNRVFEDLRDNLEEECLMNHGLIGWEYIVWDEAKSITADRQVPPAVAPAAAQGSPVNSELRDDKGEKIGFSRVLEVLEAIDWTAEPAAFNSDEEGDDDFGDMIDDDALHFLDRESPDITVTTKDGNSYSNINKQAQANLRPKSSVGSEAGTSTITEGLLARDNREFQREMLGFKMAMLDLKDGGGGGASHAPSSLAGEFDVDDITTRTPLRNLRDVTSSSLSTTTVDDRGSSSTAAAVAVEAKEDGDALQVEQLSGLMERVVAMREAASELSPGAERERFARREVKKIMKELG